MDTTDAYLEKKGKIVRVPSQGIVPTCFPCSGFAEFLYLNSTPKYPASAEFFLRTTNSNVAKGAAAGCKGCALIYDAATTFRRDRLPLNDCVILWTSRNDVIDSSCLKITFSLKPVRNRAKEEDVGSTKEPVTATDAADDHVREYLEYGALVRLDWSRGT